MKKYYIVCRMNVCQNWPLCRESFQSDDRKRRHEKVCPYVQVPCMSRECTLSQHRYTLPQLQHHLNVFHNYGIGEVPIRLSSMKGETQRKTKEGSYWFLWDGLFDFHTQRSTEGFIKFDGFMFRVEIKAKFTSKLELYGYGSNQREEFIVGAASFIGVEGFPKEYKFSMEYYHPHNPTEHQHVLIWDEGHLRNKGIQAPIQKGSILADDWHGQECGIPTSIARRYQANRDLQISIVIEKKETRRWQNYLGPLNTFHDYLIMP